MDIALWIITGVALAISYYLNPRKTVKAVKMSAKRLWKITPLFIAIMVIFAFFISSVPHSLIEKTIGAESGITGLIISLGAGSIALMPGFIAFPLCAMLKAQGVPYYILAGFSAALMNVGVFSFPLQKQYLGWKVAVLRNVIGFITAMLIAVIVGLFFGEVGL